MVGGVLRIGSGVDVIVGCKVAVDVGVRGNVWVGVEDGSGVEAEDGVSETVIGCGGTCPQAVRKRIPLSSADVICFMIILPELGLLLKRELYM